ncbi:zinc metallopeptidase [Candidatus Bipolaricaulota bacterium]|nr:zinc metallopeptidase [Candidatus Bipolaricaulota bacterium]MBS3791896.1 zinc metallopeptidase [Candidatus Bipolaricaulota bacterium]
MGFITENYLAIGFSLVGILVVISLIVRRVADSYIQRFEEDLTNSGLNGRVFVDRVMESEDIDVTLEEVEGEVRGEFLHEEGIVKVPELENSSLLTLGISAHELAHASQFSRMLFLVAATKIFEKLGVFLSYIFPLALIIGFIFYFPLLKVSLVLYLLVLLILLTRITLEIDASRKALAFLDRYGELTELELARLKKLLGLAILTRLTDLTAGFLVLLDLKEKR